MTSELYLGVKLNLAEKMRVIKIKEINLKEKVETLRSKTAQQVNISSDAFNLIYCGCLLKNDSTMKSCGLKSGSFVHVLKKIETKESTSVMSDAEIEALINVFKSFAKNPSLESAMIRLIKKPDFNESIISSCPGLSNDTIALGILQDPNLMIYLTNAITLQRIAKIHPSLLEAAQKIASDIQEEAKNDGSNSGRAITNDMVNEAMREAFENSLHITTSPVANRNATSANNTQSQLLIMREMGLENDSINREALQISDGDLQTAIELVFSGFGDN